MFCTDVGNNCGPNLSQLVDELIKAQSRAPYEKEPTYSDDELQILKTTYPNSGAMMCAALMPNHSINSIYHMAQRMGLKNRPVWQDAEIAHLKTAINSGTQYRIMVKELAAMGFNRTFGGVREKAKALKRALATVTATA